jgi:uncharacterized protein YkwD
VAHLLRLFSGVTLASLALVLATGSAAAMAADTCAEAKMSPRDADLDRVRAATLCLLNVERARRDLPSLRADEQLGEVATAYSEKMVRRHFFAHVCPDGSTVVSRIRTRTQYLLGSLLDWAVGENLAWGTGTRGTPRAIVRAWMRSAAHRRTILNPRFRDVGIGVAAGAPRRIGRRTALTYTAEFGYRAAR